MRAFGEGLREALQKVAARKAFWRIPKHELLKLAKYLGYNWIKSKWRLFEIVYALVMAILELTPDVTLAIVLLRLARMEKDTAMEADLMLVEDATEVLEKQDRKALEKRKKAMQETSTEYKEFKADYKEKRRDVNKTVKKRFGAKAGAPGAPPPRCASQIGVPTRVCQ